MDDGFTTRSVGPMQVMVYEGEAEGAIPNGSRVRKCRLDMGGVDTIPIGGLGTVYSSIACPLDVMAEAGVETYEGDEFAYFIWWDDFPTAPVFTRGYKVEAAL